MAWHIMVTDTVAIGRELPCSHRVGCDCVRCMCAPPPPPRSWGRVGIPLGSCGVSKHALLHCVKPFPSLPVCCFLSDLAGQRQPLPNSREGVREGGMCHGKGGSPVETKHLKTSFDS